MTCYLINPFARRIEPVPVWAFSDFDGLRHGLGRAFSSPLRWHVVSQEAIGLDACGKHIDAPLVLVTGQQGGLAVPESFRIGSEIYSGVSLLACRLDGDRKVFDHPSGQTGLLRTTLDHDQVAKMVVWKPTHEEESVAPTHFNDRVLIDYCRRLAALAEEVENLDKPPYKLRAYAVDVDGRECAAANIDVFDAFRGLHRWACDAYDRHQNPLCEWALREGCAYGSSELTRPVMSLANVAEKPTPGAMVLHGPDRDYHITPGVSPWCHGAEPMRVPFPGLSWFRPYEAKGDVLVTCEVPVGA